MPTSPPMTPDQKLEAPFSVPVRVQGSSATDDLARVVDARGWWLFDTSKKYAYAVVAALNAHYSPAPTAPGESDEIRALRERLTKATEELRRREEFDRQHSMDVLVEFDRYERMEKAEADVVALREQLAELRAQNMVYDSVAVDREQECIALREQLAGVRRIANKLRADSLPDPNDEREVSSVWLSKRMREAADVLAALPASAAEGKS